MPFLLLYLTEYFCILSKEDGCHKRRSNSSTNVRQKMHLHFLDMSGEFVEYFYIRYEAIEVGEFFFERNCSLQNLSHGFCFLGRKKLWCGGISITNIFPHSLLHCRRSHPRSFSIFPSHLQHCSALPGLLAFILSAVSLKRTFIDVCHLHISCARRLTLFFTAYRGGIIGGEGGHYVH